MCWIIYRVEGWKKILKDFRKHQARGKIPHSYFRTSEGRQSYERIGQYEGIRSYHYWTSEIRIPEESFTVISVLQFREKKGYIKEVKKLMKEHPKNEEAFFQYWNIVKQKGDIDELELISNQLEKVWNHNSVPINSWVNALFKHSEMMVLKGNKYSNSEDRLDPNGVYSNYIEEAIRALKKVSSALPPLPLPSLFTIEEGIKIKDEHLENLNLDERKLSKESSARTKDEEVHEHETSFLGFNVKRFLSKNVDYGKIL